MDTCLKVRILELNGLKSMKLQHSGLCQDLYAVYPRRIRRIEHLEGHLDTLKTYTAYDPIIYAVS